MTRLMKDFEQPIQCNGQSVLHLGVLMCFGYKVVESPYNLNKLNG